MKKPKKTLKSKRVMKKAKRATQAGGRAGARRAVAGARGRGGAVARVAAAVPIADAAAVLAAKRAARVKPFKQMVRAEILAYLQGFSPAELSVMRGEFLDLLRHGKKHEDALEACGLPWEFLSRLMQADNGFKAEYEEARTARDRMLLMLGEDRLIERGLEGTDKPIEVGGVTIGMERIIDQRCLELVLKSLGRDRYGDRQDITSGGERVNGPQLVVVHPPIPKTVEEFKRMVAEVEGEGKT